MSRSHSSLQDFIVRSPLVKISFAGFESNTARLQDAGWALSARQSHSLHNYGYEIQLIMSHGDNGLTMMTNLEVFDVHRFIGQFRREELEMYLSIAAISINQRNYIMPNPKAMSFTMKMGDFSAIDAMPSYERIDLSEIDFRKFGVFRKINDAANIYLPEKTVDELLKEILGKQDPKQAEIRQRKRREAFINDNFVEVEKNPNNHIRAQLIAV